MVSSFHPQSMCKRVERVTSKTWCTSCTKRTISFEVSGFHTETCLLQHAFQMNYEKVESWHGIIIIVVEKVFSFSSLVSFPYCVVTMDNLHHLSGCLGQPWLWREEFHETFHNLQTCLFYPPLPRCPFFLKELCGALAHHMMYSLFLIFSFSRFGRHVLHIDNMCHIIG